VCGLWSNVLIEQNWFIMNRVDIYLSLEVLARHHSNKTWFIWLNYGIIFSPVAYCKEDVSVCSVRLATCSVIDVNQSSTSVWHQMWRILIFDQYLPSAKCDLKLSDSALHLVAMCLWRCRCCAIPHLWCDDWQNLLCQFI